MSTKLVQSAQQILSKTEEMERLLKARDIGSFNQVQAERDSLIAELERESFDQSPETPETIQAKALLIEAQRMNTQMAAQLKTLQQDLLDEKSRAAKGRKMNQAYQANRD